MIQSLLLGAVLGLGYLYCLKRWGVNPSLGASAFSRTRLVGNTLFRLLFIALIFLLIAWSSVLVLSNVLLAFILVITFYFLNLARKAFPSATKTGATLSHRRF